MEREGGAPDPPGTPPAMAPLCRHWARKGRCDYGDRCRFRHERVPSDDPPSTSGGVEEGDATADDDGGYRPQQNQREGATRFGRRHHARNRNKAGDFRRWLVDTFGFDTLSSGEGILDVAGGKGELAFELRNISGIPVTVVDPRPMRLDRYVRRFRSGIYHRNQSQVASKLRRPQTSSLSAPTHLRMFLHKGVFDPSATKETRRAATTESYALAHATRWSRRGLVETESAPTADIPGDIPARVNLDEAYRVPGAPVRHKTMFTRAPPSSNSSASVDLPIVKAADVMNEERTKHTSAMMSAHLLMRIATPRRWSRSRWIPPRRRRLANEFYPGVPWSSVYTPIRPRTPPWTSRWRTVNRSRWSRAARTRGIFRTGAARPAPGGPKAAAL